MNQKDLERQSQREQDNRQELVARLAHAIPADGSLEPIKGLHLVRSSRIGDPVYGVLEATFCITAQATKEVFLGGHRYQYDSYSYLLSTAELPIVSRILAASPEQPYLGLRLDIDPALVGSVMLDIGQLPPRSQAPARAIEVSPLDATLLDAVVRLVGLLAMPDDAPHLLPLVSREIVYRLLIGEQGHRLRQLAVIGGHTQRITATVQKICREFNQPLHVEGLAQGIGMSVSSFHYYFKEVTAMSPLQFQKRLRLQEARRLMLGEGLDAAGAGYRVGYSDASHFTRDYKRLFGTPPMRDVDRLRGAVRESADL